jgi:hypothetical protein
LVSANIHLPLLPSLPFTVSAVPSSPTSCIFVKYSGSEVGLYYIKIIHAQKKRNRKEDEKLLKSKNKKKKKLNSKQL